MITRIPMRYQIFRHESLEVEHHTELGMVIPKDHNMNDTAVRHFIFIRHNGEYVLAEFFVNGGKGTYEPIASASFLPLSYIEKLEELRKGGQVLYVDTRFSTLRMPSSNKIHHLPSKPKQKVVPALCQAKIEFLDDWEKTRVAILQDLRALEHSAFLLDWTHDYLDGKPKVKLTYGPDKLVVGFISSYHSPQLFGDVLLSDIQGEYGYASVSCFERMYDEETDAVTYVPKRVPLTYIAAFGADAPGMSKEYLGISDEVEAELASPEEGAIEHTTSPTADGSLQSISDTALSKGQIGSLYDMSRPNTTVS